MKFRGSTTGLTGSGLASKTSAKMAGAIHHTVRSTVIQSQSSREGKIRYFALQDGEIFLRKKLSEMDLYRGRETRDLPLGFTFGLYLWA